MFPYKTYLMGGLEQLTLHSHYFTTPNVSTYFLVPALSGQQDSLAFIKVHSRTFQNALGSTPSLQRGPGFTQACALPVSPLWGAVRGWGQCSPEHRAHNWGTKPHEDSRLYLHSCWHGSCMNIPFHKQQHQTQHFQNKGLLHPPSAGKADAGLFLEPQAFVLCLNSPLERKWG